MTRKVSSSSLHSFSVLEFEIVCQKSQIIMPEFWWPYLANWKWGLTLRGFSDVTQKTSWPICTALACVLNVVVSIWLLCSSKFCHKKASFLNIKDWQSKQLDEYKHIFLIVKFNHTHVVSGKKYICYDFEFPQIH